MNIPDNLSDMINHTGAEGPKGPAATPKIEPKNEPITYGLFEISEFSRNAEKDRKARFMAKYLKFLPDAEAARGRSKDRSTKVGAVVIDDDFNVRISGYNGMARGVNDNVEARHKRPAKYLWAAHSEENCVAQAARIGVSLKGCTILLTSLFPCTTCSRLIIQSGITRIIAPAMNCAGDGKPDRENWDEQTRIAVEMLEEAGVEILYYGEVQ